MVTNRSTISTQLITKKVTNAPLVTFRVLFGLLMFLSIVRFWANGWIYTQYIEPKFFFPFIPGVAPLSGGGMYAVFFLMALSALGIMTGLFYRWSTAVFFLLFTYVELIDKTNYLNHYYFVSLMSFLLIWLPAHHRFSLDVWRGAVAFAKEIPVVFINVIKLQLGIVYFFAGIAKINYDWLIHAQPMKLWLSSLTHKPLIGELLRYKITAYLFSWAGMFFDTTIPFLLMVKKTLPFAYMAVIVFHLLTGWLFAIGMFPYIMIVATTIFFPAHFHEKLLTKAEGFFKRVKNQPDVENRPGQKVRFAFFVAFFALQILIPMRYLAYPGNIFWNESGYRFSWRVMLMEKAGQVSFYIIEDTKKHLVANYEYLTPQQEKMMATQPDMILQFAHFLHDEFQQKGFTDPKIKVESFVTLNGRPHRPYVDPELNLSDKNLKTSEMVLAYE